VLASLPIGNTVRWSLAVPENPALFGSSVWVQMVALEFGPGMSWLQTSNTNSIHLTPGVF
jgi:hypothetical protein